MRGNYGFAVCFSELLDKAQMRREAEIRVERRSFFFLN